MAPYFIERDGVMFTVNMRILGAMCRSFRISLGVTQKEIARDIDCGQENVSAFENGRNRNCVILLWYVNKGFDLGGYGSWIQ